MFDEDDIALLGVRSTKYLSADQDEGDSLILNGLQKPRLDRPCHQIRDSLFSSSSGCVDYRGIYKFSIILVVFAIAHIALENFIKYGILYDPVQLLKDFVYKPTESPSCLILLGLNVFVLPSLGIEKLLSKGLFSEKVGVTIIVTLLTSEILIPPIMLYLTDCCSVASFIIMLIVISVFLKLASYHITNFWCRESSTLTRKVRQLNVSSGMKRDTRNANANESLVHYPENLNFKDLYYFLFAPTLCYELNFPRSPCIRKLFLTKRVLEMLFLLLLNVFLLQQCCVPIANETLKSLQEMDYSRILESVFKLTIPFMCTVLMTAYCFFHSYLNALAEILRFGDRHFYCDFWNSKTSIYFWQNWNVLVYKWCIRHLYLPLRHCGFTNSQSSTVVFLVSAVFHEYIFIVSFKMFRIWSFLVMLVQAPYIIFVDTYLPAKYGSIVGSVFFSSIMSSCYLMYYNDYYVLNYHSIETAV